MEELSHDDVLQILTLIERSDVEYLELEIGGTRIVADRGRSGPRAGAAVAPVAAAVAPVPAVATVPAAPASAPAPATSTEASGEEGCVTITAPVVGVFYRAPEPGSAPYCNVGDAVTVGSTVGLVEVMKVFNSVTTEVSGEVVRILAGNEEFVEFGQPLFLIRPAV